MIERGSIRLRSCGKQTLTDSGLVTTRVGNNVRQELVNVLTHDGLKVPEQWASTLPECTAGARLTKKARQAYNRSNSETVDVD